ncbi:hypothetical protein [Protofrankia symbiont of Coriaria ruscifolia]|uniref:Uncharacterized protein n=1 Tax=Candidatus Protofrankia californiensis TaxID=1839754 RepID=A0A1C3NZA9_9ACTN|nr:hypothetical protein [Protofrankia symbiont of Coriaria ruscifolia]SBW22828.1 hypothetical protein FDG2_3192 [Candidatus Protofrankia californiensis]
MTVDVIALCRARPDIEASVTALVAASPHLRVVPVSHGAVMQLADDDGRPLVSIESPVLVQVPGEAQRLLGPEVSMVDAPLWWVEARATSAREGTEDIARRFAHQLVCLLGGVVWPIRDEGPEKPESPATINGVMP